MSFYRDVIRTAKKEHKCGICHGKILPGEKYHDKAGNSANDENEIFWGRECMGCQPVITEYVCSDSYDSCEGYCDEYIHDWWVNEKCYDCKHRYLLCIPDDNCKRYFQHEGGNCPERTKYGTCSADDTCDDMTHYCRCDKWEKAD